MGSICRFARYSRISPLSFDSHDFVRWHFIGYLLSRRGKFDCKVELCTGPKESIIEMVKNNVYKFMYSPFFFLPFTEHFYVSNRRRNISFDLRDEFQLPRS